MAPELSRRNFLAGSLAATAVGSGICFNPNVAFAGDPEKDLTWHNAPCRFCGTGCTVEVGVARGKVVAVRGAPKGHNSGCLCAKGYSLAHIQYGGDRLTRPLLRMKGGRHHKQGTLTPVSWDRALEVMAAKAKAALKQHGPSSVAMYGSGQWTVWEGYAALKLWKAGLRSNSLEVNARHCMASAVAGFMTTFGMDEPMGTYDDIDKADAFVLWGANMAEMHPILHGRVSQRLRASSAARLYNLTTISNLSSAMAHKELIFKPQSDLALANGIANLLIKEGKVNEQFVTRHTIFKKGKEKIGYGMEDKFKFKDAPQIVDFAAYKAYVAAYTPERVAQISGVSPADLKALAAVYGDPRTKVISFWTMGMNQHTRGTWINNLVYNLHLLTGKIAEPGNQPYSLTGQPSACGTCREVGTFTHRLPADMVVANPAHRARAEKLWKVPAGTIPAKPSYHAIEMMRALDRGEVRFFWSQTANPFHTYPNLERFRAGARKDGRFIVVSDVYPTRSTEVADLVLPAAMWVEKEGAFGNAERRTQLWNKMADAPGEAKSDLWQTLAFARKMGLGKLLEAGKEAHPLAKGHPASDASQLVGFHIEKAMWEEYRQFGLGHGHDLAPYDAYVGGVGLRWPVVEGKETVIRYREGYDPYVAKGKGVDFYGNKKHGGKAVIWLRPYEPAAEVPDKTYPFWLCTGRVLEHWHSGTMTRRVRSTYRGYPHATANLHPDDIKRLGLKDGDKLRVTSRRGSAELYLEAPGRTTPQPGMVYVPFFDEDVMINDVTLDAFCPISKEADYKKCAVSVKKVSR